MSWSDYVRQVKINFRTPAPDDAPEVKGYRCYFRPEWLEWRVTPDEIRVGAFGPATRVQNHQGEMWWTVEGGYPHRAPDRPTWLMLPIDLLAHANLAVADLEERRREAQR